MQLSNSGLLSPFLPSWGIKVSEVIHYYEAILATLSILIFHLFYTIFHPKVYPMNLTFLTGEMEEKEMAEEHPKWYKESETQKTKNPEEPNK